MTISVRSYARWLWVLAGLFAGRVIAQPVAALLQTSVLPSFESWHSGVLPYPLLLTTQLLILGWLVRTAWQLGSGQLMPRRRVGQVALGAGGLYFALMLLRLLLGTTLLRQQRWFASPLPTLFHLVLATYLLVYGRFHHYSHSASLTLRQKSADKTLRGDEPPQ